MDISETRINIGDDWANVSFKSVNLCNDSGGVIRRLQLIKKIIEIHFIGLTQRGVDLLNKIHDGGFFMHGLIRQMTETIAQACNHPSR